MLMSLLIAQGIGVTPAVQQPQQQVQQPPPAAAAVTADQELDAEAATKHIENLLLDSATAYERSDEPRGRELAEAALALATRHALPALQAEAWFRLGRDDRWFERFELAREKYERSRDLFLQVGNRGRAAYVEAYLGTALSESGELALALETLQRALATLRDVGDKKGMALAGEALMFAMPESAEKDRLRPGVLADIRAYGDKATECNIGQNWGDGLFMAGRYAEAYTVLTEAVRCFEQTNDLGRTGRVLVSLGRVERVHGQLDKALDNYTRALALQDRAKDAPAAIQSLNAMAVTLTMLGRNDEAEERYRDAIERARARVPNRVNLLLGNLGGIYLEMGRFQRAAELLAASRAKEKEPTMYAWRTRQLGWAQLRLGRPAEALALANESVELTRTSGPEMRLRALHTRAGVLHAIGRLDDARRDLTEATAIVDDLRRNTVAADIMRRGFGETMRLLYDMSIEVQLASKDGRAALATSEQARSRAFLDRLASRETARATASDTTAATTLASRAASSTSSASAPPAPTVAAASSNPPPIAAQPAAAVPVPPSAALVPGAAATALTRGSNPPPVAAERAAAVPASPSAASVVGVATAATSSPAAEASAPTAAPASVADIQALAARFRSTWLIFWVGQSATTVWVVQPSGAVHWRRLPISGTQLETLVAQSVPRGSGLDGLAAMSFASRAHLRPWRELYQKLLLPVSRYLPTTPGSRLTIVPHGPLFRLSFAALQDEQGRYLLERYELHYVPAAGVLQFTAAANRHAQARGDGALLVGDPLTVGTAPTAPGALSTGMRGMIVRGASEDASANASPSPSPIASAAQAPRGGVNDGGTGRGTVSTTGGGNRATADSRNRSAAPTASAMRSGSSLPALGWARREVLSILKLLPRDSVALVGAEATESAVRERMPGRRVIHFATHGVVFNSDAAVSSSYLAVSGERNGATPSAAVPDANADGRLTADEIDRLTLDADLVVLSACGTALGPISGDGVQGFTRAFLSAGADSVIATTWSVADRTSYQVMERFYRGWLSGQSKSRALRQAQLGLLKQLRTGGVTIDGVVLHDSPWLWAGFVLVGNP